MAPFVHMILFRKLYPIMCLTPLAVLWHSALRCRGIAFLMGLFSDLFGINSAMYIGVWSAIGLVLGMYLLGLTKRMWRRAGKNQGHN